MQSPGQNIFRKTRQPKETGKFTGERKRKAWRGFLQPAFGFWHFREHIPQVPAEQPDNNTDEQHAPAELTKHSTPGSGGCRERRVKLLDEIIPETVKKGCRPDAAGPEPEITKLPPPAFFVYVREYPLDAIGTGGVPLAQQKLPPHAPKE